MTRNQAIEIARQRALNTRESHGYLPVTEADAQTWMPHEWVIDAILWATMQRDLAALQAVNPTRSREEVEGDAYTLGMRYPQQAAQPVAPSDTEWSIIHALVNCAMATESDAAMHQIDRLAKHYGMKDKRGQSLRAKLLRHEQLQHPRRPFRLTPSEAAQPQHTAQPLAKQLSRGQIGDIVREHLRGLYYCGRVWEAWSVGTMSEDDFSPAEELDTADEIADSLWAGMTQASWAAQPPAQPDKEHNHE